MDNIHIAQGFKAEDKQTLEGVVKGLRYAVEFCADEADKKSLNKLADVVEFEAEWIFWKGNK